jgi:twinkle protein
MSTEKEPCPKCGSSNNLARFEDGHAWCFTPGCEHREPARDGTQPPRLAPQAPRSFSPVLGEVRFLEARRIGEETCQKFNYQVGTFAGKPCQIANYYTREGELVAQKIRFADKTFTIQGNGSNMPLYGQHLWRDGGKMIVITEGEIDALSVSQVQGNKWPVVSLPNGAPNAKKSLAQHLEWLEKFETVVLMFDNDEHGKKAAEECAPLFTPGRCKIAALVRKDANEHLKHGEVKQILDAMWGAKEYRPDGIVTIDDLRDALSRPVGYGRPWVYESLTKETYGRRDGEIYFLGAGTGVGKTDFLTEQIAYDLQNLGVNVGVIFLEQPPVETLRRIAGKVADKRFHVPDAGWTAEQLQTALATMERGGKLYLYNHFGAAEWDLIKARIRFLVVSQGCKHIYLDHLTALAAAADDERTALEGIMSDLGALTQELNFVLHGVSHLATPEGKPHEEGGRVMIRHFKGSRSIGYWSHFMFGMERNQQAEDESERQTTTFRILKDRYTGQATGKTFLLGYDAERGRLFEKDMNPFAEEGGATAKAQSGIEF